MATDCSLFPDNPNYCDVIVAVKRTVGSLSMIGSFFIIFIIWLFEKYKYFEQRLLLALSVAAFMSCISYLIGDLHPKKGPVCVLQAWWLTYFNRCVILWVCCITINIYWNLIKERNTRRFEKWYHVVCWGISFVISLLPLIDDHYGPAGPWCWIPRESSNSTVWRFMMWYVPLFIIITILFIVYGYIFYAYRKKEREWRGMFNVEQQRQKEIFKKKVRPLLAYPCIYLATSICPLIHRIYNVTTATPSFPLLLLHVIFNPLAGVLNAIAYGFDKETLSKLNRHHIKAAFLHHFRPAPVAAEYQTDPTVTVYKHINSENDFHPRTVNQDNTIKELQIELQGVQNGTIEEADSEAGDDANNVTDDETNVADDANNVADDETNVADDETNVADDVNNVADDANVADDVKNVAYDANNVTGDAVTDDVNNVRDGVNIVTDDVAMSQVTQTEVRDDVDNEVKGDTDNEVRNDVGNEVKDQK